MRITRLLAILPALLVLGACGTTTVRGTQMFATGTLKFTTVKADCGVPGAPVQLADELRQSVMARLSSVRQGTRPVEVDLHIVSYRVVPASERYMLGPFAGNNDMIVSVTLKDAAGTVLETFSVDRSQMHGSMDGAFTNSKAELLNDASQRIALVLSGQEPHDGYVATSGAAQRTAP